MKQYLFSVVASVLILLGGFGAFNYFVDPLLLYHERDGDAATLNRIDQFYNMRLYKPLHVRRLAPDAIIIGSSRAGTIRPRHPAWQDLSPYNFSMPGMTIAELDLLVRHAQASRPLRKLMIGLDYQALVTEQWIYRKGFEPARLASGPSGFHSFAYIEQRVRDLQATLFSFDILEQSLAALAPERRRIRQYYLDGVWESISDTLKGRSGFVFASRGTIKSGSWNKFDSESNLSIFRDLLDFCHRNNIETRLFLTPTHVFNIDLWFRLASDELWRSTHRKLLVINREVAEGYDRPPFEIRGFGNEQDIVNEPIYRRRNIGAAWFNDSVHYRAKFASKIMAAVWDPASDSGQRLTIDNIDDYLASIESLRDSFMESNRQLVDELYEKIGMEL